MPAVSVVVATYRRDSKLRCALESLLTQTYKDFEVIVVDDNDFLEWNNKVSEIIDNFKSSNPDIKIKYFQNHPGLGSALARNKGIDVSSGEFICFLDDDDIFLPKRIENQIIPMIEADADYSVTDLALYNESGKLVEIRNRKYIIDTSKEQLQKYHLLYNITGTDSMMFRRSYLHVIGSFSPIDIGDEYYLMQKAIENNGKFLYVPVCDIKAYVHNDHGGLSSSDEKIDGENELYTFKKKYFDYLDFKGRQYVKMRHHAVLAYAYIRNRRYLLFIKESILSFFSSPVFCFKLFFDRFNSK